MHHLVRNSCLPGCDSPGLWSSTQEAETSLIYTLCSRPAMAAEWDPVIETTLVASGIAVALPDEGAQGCQLVSQLRLSLAVSAHRFLFTLHLPGFTSVLLTDHLRSSLKIRGSSPSFFNACLWLTPCIPLLSLRVQNSLSFGVRSSGGVPLGLCSFHPDFSKVNLCKPLF